MRRLFTLLFLLGIVFTTFAQEKTITGVITAGDSGEPLPGVSVSIKGTTIGTITDLDGNYNINASEGDVLLFSFVGYIAEEVAVATETTINIILELDVLSMEEVVVIGYGTQKKSLVTGAIAKVDGEDLNKGQARVEQALQGKSAGVIIT